MALSALALNCSLKRADQQTSTGKLLDEVLAALATHRVSGKSVRVTDFDIRPGVTNDEGDGDQWPMILKQVLEPDIIIVGTPIWLGQPSQCGSSGSREGDARHADDGRGRQSVAKWRITRRREGDSKAGARRGRRDATAGDDAQKLKSHIWLSFCHRNTRTLTPMSHRDLNAVSNSHKKRHSLPRPLGNGGFAGGGSGKVISPPPSLAEMRSAAGKVSATMKTRLPLPAD